MRNSRSHNDVHTLYNYWTQCQKKKHKTENKTSRSKLLSQCICWAIKLEKRICFTSATWHMNFYMSCHCGCILLNLSTTAVKLISTTFNLQVCFCSLLSETTITWNSRNQSHKHEVVTLHTSMRCHWLYANFSQQQPPWGQRKVADVLLLIGVCYGEVHVGVHCGTFQGCNIFLVL